jgi:iron complex transport system ATP-binding protein
MTSVIATGLRAGYRDTDVLRGIDLTLEAGAVVAVVGPNGAGKSTLLRCLAGLIRPSAGTVLLDGIDLRTLERPAIARRVAVVPQSFETIFPFAVREVVALGRSARLGIFGLPSRADASAVERAIAELDLVGLADRRLDEVSGGERQRTVLAMALAQDGDVLLLDEPTVHLDPAHQRDTLEIVRRATRARGLVSVAVLHDLNLAAAMCDRIVVLDRGVVVADGTPREVLDPHTIARVFGPRLRVGSYDGVPFVRPESSV